MIAEKKLLTVVIPTYNRPRQLLATLEKLLPQITNETEVMVLDNCSDTILKTYISDNMGVDRISNLTFIRHPVNIGPDANFAEAFRLSNGEFTWVLGDDDDVADNAVTLIIKELSKFNKDEIIGINFYTNCCQVARDTAIVISSISDIAHKLDFFGNWFFISASVYNTEEYLKHIRFAYWGAYSMASQIIPAVVAISQGKKFILSEKYTVTNLKATEEEQWSHVQVSLTLPELLELPIYYTEKEFLAIGEKLSVQFVSYPHAFFCMLRSLKMNPLLIDRYHIFLLRQLHAKTFTFKKNKVKQYLTYQAILFLAKNRKLTDMILKSSSRIRNRIDRSNYVKFKLFERK
jgi:glycosyltransferase involved in cell wall biosynthesis